MCAYTRGHASRTVFAFHHRRGEHSFREQYDKRSRIAGSAARADRYGLVGSVSTTLGGAAQSAAGIGAAPEAGWLLRTRRASFLVSTWPGGCGDKNGNTLCNPFGGGRFPNSAPQNRRFGEWLEPHVGAPAPRECANGCGTAVNRARRNHRRSSRDNFIRPLDPGGRRYSTAFHRHRGRHVSSCLSGRPFAPFRRNSERHSFSSGAAQVVSPLAHDVGPHLSNFNTSDD